MPPKQNKITFREGVMATSLFCWSVDQQRPFKTRAVAAANRIFSMNGRHAAVA